MWPLVPVIALLSFIGVRAHTFYDRPIPPRCATSDEAYSVDNRDFCKAWFVAHYVGPKQRAPE